MSRPIAARIGTGVAVGFTALALVLAVRDLLGVHDAFPYGCAVLAPFDQLRGGVRLFELAVAAAILWKCRDRSEGRILAGALIGLSLNNNWWFYSTDDWWFWLAITVNYLGVGYGMMQFIRFASTYTASDSGRFRANLSKLAPWFGLWIALFGSLSWMSTLLWPSVNHATLWNRFYWAGWDVGNEVVIAAAITGWLYSKGADRTRMTAVAGAFCIAAFGTFVHGAARAIQGETSCVEIPWVNYFDTILQLALPIGLTYAVAKYRFLDIEFLMTWAPVCIVLSGLVILTQVLIEHFAGSAARAFGGEYAEIGVSLAVVVATERLFKGVDRRIEHLRFKEVDEQIAALRDFAERQVPTLNDPSAIADRLLRTIELNAAATAVALFRKAEALFVRISSTMLKAPPSVPEGDPAIRKLESLRRPSMIDEKDTVLPRSHAFPMVARARLGGFVLCEAREWTQQQEDAICEAVNAATLAMEDARIGELERRIQELEAANKA